MPRPRNEVLQRIDFASLSRHLRPGESPEVLISDFDFDGSEDFAVHDADDASYGGPTCSVFLFVPRAGAFRRSPAISNLTELSLAEPPTDPERRRILIASNSGCCHHWYESYEVVRGIPRLASRRTYEDAPDGSCTMTTETRHRNGHWHRARAACPAVILGAP